jgi:hypothetical protein
MANGIITRKDIIEDQALTIGTEYAKNMQPAIEANKQLVASLKEMAPLINAFRKTDSQQAYAIKTTGKYYYTSSGQCQ